MEDAFAFVARGVTLSPSRSTSFAQFEIIQMRYASTSSTNGLPVKRMWRSFLSLRVLTWDGDEGGGQPTGC